MRSRNSAFSTGVFFTFLLMTGIGCQSENNWRSYTNLPEFEGACVELTADCTFQISGNELYMIDPSIAYLFPDITGTLPKGQRLKIASITPGGRGTGLFKIVATASEGPFKGKQFIVSELFDNQFTDDGHRKIYSMRPILKRCVKES